MAETTHDCGEIGGLAQSRKRFLLVARHAEKVPAFLYEPEKKPLRAVGDILGRMPLPGAAIAGPMHRVPSLQWKTWVRLAFVEAGSDWRSLNKLAVEDGKLRDFLIVPAMHNGVLGVQQWHEPSGTVAGASRPGNGAFSVADPRKEIYSAGYGVNRWDAPTGAVAGESLPSNGRFAVADPRFDQSAKWHDGQAYGVRRWDESTGAIAGQQNPGQGAYSVADPRCGATKHNNCFRVVRMGDPSPSITGGTGPSAGGLAVADPRGPEGKLFGKYHCADWNAPGRTVIGGDNNGAYGVADPRPGMARERGDNYLTGGHYGVVPWADPAGAVSASPTSPSGATATTPTARPTAWARG